jgi:ferredoxin
MTTRAIIKIDEEKCNGCGLCIPNCQEGALQIIDNKARLISDLFCDGLGACLSHCPKGAITIEEREAEEYDEVKVMKENIIPKGANTIKAHLNHLKEHGVKIYLQQALQVLDEEGIAMINTTKEEKSACGCPGAKMMQFEREDKDQEATENNQKSELRQWPVQLHLVSPQAPYFEKADVLLAADCTAYALGDFHKHLKGKGIVIACPKLDSNKEVYVDKLKVMMENAKINTLTVMVMEVPCCAGLIMLAKEARDKAERKVPIKKIVVGIKGNILSDEWL